MVLEVPHIHYEKLYTFQSTLHSHISLILRVTLRYNHPQLTDVFCKGKKPSGGVTVVCSMYTGLCYYLTYFVSCAVCHGSEIYTYLIMHPKEKNPSSVYDPCFVLSFCLWQVPEL